MSAKQITVSDKVREHLKIADKWYERVQGFVAIVAVKFLRLISLRQHIRCPPVVCRNMTST